MGIPQIVCPGGLAQCARGPLESMPQSYLDGYADGSRKSFNDSGKPYCHNEAITVLTPTLEETRILALEIVTKLNQAKGPTALILPMQGWSAYDQSAELVTIERGWAKENGAGPVWLPDPENQKWSLRAITMWSVFDENIDRDKPNIDLIKCDMHLLDTQFADLLNQCMADMLDGKWHQELYSNKPGVLQ